MACHIAKCLRSIVIVLSLVQLSACVSIPNNRTVTDSITSTSSAPPITSSLSSLSHGSASLSFIKSITQFDTTVTDSAATDSAAAAKSTASSTESGTDDDKPKQALQSTLATSTKSPITSGEAAASSAIPSTLPSGTFHVYTPSVPTEAAPSASATTSSSSSSSSSADSRSTAPFQISQPAKIAAIAGASGLATAITVVLFLCLRRPRHESMKTPEEDDKVLVDSDSDSGSITSNKLTRRKTVLPTTVFHPDWNNQFHRPLDGHEDPRYPFKHTSSISSSNSEDILSEPTNDSPVPSPQYATYPTTTTNDNIIKFNNADKHTLWISRHQEQEQRARELEEEEAAAKRQSMWNKFAKLRTWGSVVVRRNASTKTTATVESMGTSIGGSGERTPTDAVAKMMPPLPKKVVVREV